VQSAQNRRTFGAIAGLRRFSNSYVALPALVKVAFS